MKRRRKKIRGREGVEGGRKGEGGGRDAEKIVCTCHFKKLSGKIATI